MRRLTRATSSSSHTSATPRPIKVVAVLKAREPARLLIAIGKKAANRWHLAFAQRWVVHYNFWVFSRICG